MDSALHLVKGTTKSLDEIATEVGYSSSFALSKAFKRHFGESPTHFAIRDKVGSSS